VSYDKTGRPGPLSNLFNEISRTRRPIFEPWVTKFTSLLGGSLARRQQVAAHHLHPDAPYEGILLQLDSQGKVYDALRFQHPATQ